MNYFVLKIPFNHTDAILGDEKRIIKEVLHLGGIVCLGVLDSHTGPLLDNNDALTLVSSKGDVYKARVRIGKEYTDYPNPDLSRTSNSLFSQLQAPTHVHPQ